MGHEIDLLSNEGCVITPPNFGEDCSPDGGEAPKRYQKATLPFPLMQNNVHLVKSQDNELVLASCIITKIETNKFSRIKMSHNTAKRESPEKIWPLFSV